MSNPIADFVNEAVTVELTVAEIYVEFIRIYPEDANFWSVLAAEEKAHAALIRGIQNVLNPLEAIPEAVLTHSTEKLSTFNQHLRTLIQSCKTSAPSRTVALSMAEDIETSAAELHFQRLLEISKDIRLEKILQHLADSDKIHLNRIREYKAQVSQSQ